MRSNVHLFLYAVDKEGGCSIMQEKPMSKAKWIVAVMLVIMTGVAAYTKYEYFKNDWLDHKNVGEWVSWGWM